MNVYVMYLFRCYFTR